MELSAAQLQGLVDMFRAPGEASQDSSDDDDDTRKVGADKVCPSDLAPHSQVNKSTKKTSESEQKAPPEGEEPPASLHEEIFEMRQDEDNRPEPRYEMMYGQRVGVEDVYFGMTEKDPGTSTSDSIIIKVWLPEVTSPHDVELNVEETRVDCTTNLHRLQVHLPRPVTHGTAKWDPNVKLLQLQLPIKHQDNGDMFFK